MNENSRSRLSYTRQWSDIELRKRRCSAGEGILVAEVDTGVDIFHEDIGNIWINPGEIPENGLDDDGNGFVDDVNGWDFAGRDNSPIDQNGHGTHVAGIINAKANDGLGIVGVAPEATLMPIRGLGADGTGSDLDLVVGPVYAAQNGADIINNSWGCRDRCPSKPIVEDAIRFAAACGAVVVFAAGNSGDDVFYYSPQNMQDPYAKPVVVAANDYRRLAAAFGNGRGTNFGQTVDISAPGGGRLSDESPSFHIAERNVLRLLSSETNPLFLISPDLVSTGAAGVGPPQLSEAT